MTATQLDSGARAAQLVRPRGTGARVAIAKHRWVLRIVALGAAFLAIGAVLYWAFGGGVSVSYVTAPVDRGSITRAVTATGAVNPVLTVTVGTYVSGVIEQINCDFNTRVKKGQLCAKIDPRPYEAIVEQNRANLISAQAQLLKDRANLAYTLLNWNRYSALYKAHAGSRDSYETAVNMLEQARAQVALDEATISQRKAVLDAALVNLGYTNIVSPVDGIVVSRNVTKGQTVAASFQTPTLFLIAENLTKLQVDTNVSEGDIGAITVGDRAQFTVEAFPRKTFKGVVTQVRQAPQSVQNVVTYDVVVAADNPELLLKPGMTATVHIIIDTRSSVLRVPDQALRYVPGGLAARDDVQDTSHNHVWVLRDGKAQSTEIGTGLDDDSFTEVTSGSLATGDRVILSESSGRSSTRRTGNSESAPAMRFP